MVDKIAYRTESTKVDAEKFYSTFFEIITQELAKGNPVVFKGFGTFSVIKREERKGRNPSNGEEVTVPMTKYPRFKPSYILKEIINGQKGKGRK